jgi:hypothetical protein
MGNSIAVRFGAIVALILAGCAEAPDIDPIAQQAMIGLSKEDIFACMGEPAKRRALGEGTEILTYASGRTATDTPPWAFGLNFSAWAAPALCDVRVVMTNGRVSQVGYLMPDGRALPSGRQCSFSAQPCARRRELL